MRASGASGRRSTLIALASTVVFVVVVALVISNSPGWPEVKRLFFNGEVFRESLEVIPEAFLLNVKIFLVAEVCILVFALLIAVLRGLPGPVFFPLRAFAVVYADLFRGVPTVLVIYVLGFGVPALGLSGVPVEEVFWGGVALVLVYSAYVMRCTGPASSPCTRARRRRPARSGFRIRRRFASSSAAGGAPRDPAAPERLHRPPEGHRARRPARCRRGVQAVRDRGGGDLQLHALPRDCAPLHRADDPARPADGLARRARPAAATATGGVP